MPPAHRAQSPGVVPSNAHHRKQRGKPWLLYLSLLSLASGLAWFSLSRTPLKLPERNVHSILDIPKPLKRRVVAIGDLHGDFENTMRVLRMAGIVDHRGEWSAGSRTTLVQMGDIVDRGPDTIALYRLFSTLAESAERVGSQVISILGNHEMMNALGDWRYVTQEDIASFGGERNRRIAMSSAGWLGSLWLANYTTTARVSFVPDVAPLEPIPAAEGQVVLSPTAPSSAQLSHAAASFVHGGIHPDWALKDPSDPIGYINKIGHSLLSRAIVGPIRNSITLPPGTTQEESDYYSEGGPLWYRGYALDADERAICQLAREAMAALGVRRLIMGHTPDFDAIRSRCKGSVIIVDTGISRAYGGVLSALDISYSLSPRPLSMPIDSKRGWIEREVVTALHLNNFDVTVKTVLAKDERTIQLDVASYG